jgi:hypothetical protein
MTTLNTTANISPLPSGDYIFRVAALNSIGQGAYNTLYTAMPVPDPYFGNVSLLMHMDGTGNSFVDSSSYNHTLTVSGDATQSSDQSKFGGSSAYFDGSGDYLSASSSSFAFDTGDFTVEAWVYSSDVSSTTQRGWIQTTNQSGGLSTSYTTGIIINYNNGALRVNVAGTSIATPASLINTNQWYHIAVCRQSGIIRIFVNGNLAASGTASGNCSGQHLCVGGYYDTNYLLSGYIDEIRITKGIARYSSNFTPSPVPFPVSPIITISSQPSNQTVSAGNASFSITASVTLGATLSYQWQKKKGNSSFSNISGATSSTLSLSNLTEADNNGEIYRCIVKSTGGVSLISSVATLIVSSSGSITVEYLVIAGGGGGGGSHGGGGGAGGYRSGSTTLTAGTQYTVTVGSGGAGGVNIGGAGVAGSNSSAFTVTSAGGGGGGTRISTGQTYAGGTGGSGGGGAGTNPTTAGTGTSGQGNSGGAGSSDATAGHGGGGGGAGAAGGAASGASNTGYSGAGGNGSQWLNGTYYAGGGSGGLWDGGTVGAAGLGGGGAGGNGNPNNPGSAGIANTGGGGGGSSSGVAGSGGAGGSGVVILRTLGSVTAASTTGSPTRTESGGYTYYTFTGSGSITF